MDNLNKTVYENAQEALRKNSKYVSNWIDLALASAKYKGVSEAVLIFEEALSFPEIPKIKLIKSYIDFSIINLDTNTTKKLFIKVLDIKKTESMINDLADFLILQNEFKEAENLLSGLELTPSDTVLRSNRRYYSLATLYEKQNKFGEAIAIYENLIKRNESNAKAWRGLRQAELLLSHYKDKEDVIKKSIHFKPEFHEAGLSILQNFGKLLNDKYPNGDVAFSIQQSGMKITMIIEHPHGEREIVEDYLNRYGLVISGSIPPESFSNDPIQIMDLKRKLIQFESDFKWAIEKEEMLKGIISKQDHQISSYEAKEYAFKEQINTLLSSNTNQMSDLISIIQSKDENINILTNKFFSSVQNMDTQEAIYLAKKIELTSPPSIKKINDFITTTVASAGGNLPAWIDFVSKVIP